MLSLQTTHLSPKSISKTFAFHCVQFGYNYDYPQKTPFHYKLNIQPLQVIAIYFTSLIIFSRFVGTVPTTSFRNMPRSWGLVFFPKFSEPEFPEPATFLPILPFLPLLSICPFTALFSRQHHVARQLPLRTFRFRSDTSISRPTRNVFLQLRRRSDVRTCPTCPATLSSALSPQRPSGLDLLLKPIRKLLTQMFKIWLSCTSVKTMLWNNAKVNL